MCGRVALIVLLMAVAADAAELKVLREDGRLTIVSDAVPLAVYVFQDAEILRPSFQNLKTRTGHPVTRRHPPEKDAEGSDHPTMHPGVWLAFGDLGGADFWRNRARVEHREFTVPPRITPQGIEFTVRQQYIHEGRVLCEETCRHTVHLLPAGWRLSYDSELTTDQPRKFGDQEEMGLGVRLAADLRVKGGVGHILSSEGRQNEAAVWGREATWCEASATIDGRRRGVLLATHPGNPWPSRYHVRDYGLLVANPIGQKAFRVETPAVRDLKPGSPLRLRFHVVVFDVTADATLDLDALARP